MISIVKRFSFTVFVLFVLLFSSCSGEKLVITGSETMYPMMNFLADDFNRMGKGFSVEVRGGGSEVGIAKLVKEDTEIAASSNDINETVLSQLQDMNLFEKLTIAYDGIAIVVNKSNPVNKITFKDLSAIFSGKIKNWKELGGKNMPIQVVIRNSKSGTESYMREFVLRKKLKGKLIYLKNKNAQFVKTAKVAENNRKMADFIQAANGSIGYMGMGSSITEGKGKVKVLKFSLTGKEAYVLPNANTVQSRKYRLSRPLMLLYKTKRSNKVNTFIDYLLSKRGQNRILTSGYLESLFREVTVRARRIKKKK